ncbi:ATP-binding cassette domain-containing protein [Saccharomonospora sp. NPDC006951]
MIRASGLTRHFNVKKEKVEAVSGLDLHVEHGELVALLGPNGAGKSTTLRMLTTLLRPTSGTALVAGHDVSTEPKAVRRRIGYIGQGNGAGHSQRASDELISQGRAYGLTAAAAKERATELIGTLGLDAVAGRVVSSLSGGQRRRLDIAMGLIHTPPLLFLDEPSTGLDPQNRANLAEHVRGLREASGTTMVLTTHYLEEADQLAERVVIIDHGTVIADDTPAALKSAHAGDRVSLLFDHEHDARKATATIGTFAGTAPIRHQGSGIQVELRDGAQLTPKLLRALDDALVPVAGVEVARPTLDDVFLSLTGRSLREGEPGSEGTVA